MRILLLVILSVGLLNAQDPDTVLLEKISRVDVIYQTKEAKLSFSKKDIVSDYEKFKEGFYTPDEEKRKEYNEAISYLKKTKKVIQLEEEKKYDQKEMSLLANYIKIRGAASLINDKKAEIIRKADNRKQESVLVRPLISSPEGSAYIFLFMDSTEFFYGEVYGEVLLEEVILNPERGN